MFSQENLSQIIACKIAVILFRPQYVSTIADPSHAILWSWTNPYTRAPGYSRDDTGRI